MAGGSAVRNMPADETARLLGSLAVSLFLHGIAFVLPGGALWERSGRFSPPLSGIEFSAAASPLTVRLPSPAVAATEKRNAGIVDIPATATLQAARMEAAPVDMPPVTPVGPVTVVAPIMAEPAVPPAPAGLFPGPWYYPARHLHHRPTPLVMIQPSYPKAAEELRGRVTILVLINENGKVDDYRIEDADPPGLFEDSVADAFTSVPYTPGLITGYQVKSQFRAEVLFEPGLPPQIVVPSVSGASPAAAAPSISR
jgi:TonB family protein